MSMTRRRTPKLPTDDVPLEERWAWLAERMRENAVRLLRTAGRTAPTAARDERALELLASRPPRLYRKKMYDYEVVDGVLRAFYRAGLHAAQRIVARSGVNG